MNSRKSMRGGPKKFKKLELYSRISFLYLNKAFKNPLILKVAERKHKLVFKFLEKEQADVIEKYKNLKEKKLDEVCERYIWTLWWQGEDLAPEVVKLCLNQLKKNSNGAKVVLITKDNYKDYIELPPYILEKRDKGYITFQQLSDIIRFTLLEKYGGLWLDSTIYTSKPIPKEYFDYPFFSQHTKWADTCFVQHNLWHGFCIGSKKGGKLVSFAKEMFFDYWENHDVIVDYLMIDYILMIAYNHFNDIKEEIDSLPYSSERLYELVTILNNEYDEKYFNSLMEECIFSKLDWHKEYKLSIKGKETYYSHIVNLQ